MSKSTSTGSTTTGTSHSVPTSSSSTEPKETDGHSDASAPSLPRFVALHPPPPSEHQPPPTSKLQRMQLNAQQERSLSENRLIDFKLRLLGGVFAGLLIILPFVAYALQPNATRSSHTVSSSSNSGNPSAASTLPSNRS